MTKVKAECTRVLGKTTPGLAALQVILNDCDCDKLPSLVMSQIQDLVASVRAFHNEAQSKKESNNPSDLSFDMDAVSKLLKDVSGAKAGAASMLQSVKKMTKRD